MDLIDALSEERAARRKAEEGAGTLTAITRTLVAEAQKRDIKITDRMSIHALLVAVLAKATGENNGQPKIEEAVEAKDG